MRPALANAFRRSAALDSWREQDHRCCYCFGPMTEAEVTADHVRPRSRGGLDHADNIIAACSWCNVAKGSMSVNTFRGHIKRAETLRPGRYTPERLNLIQLARSRRRINLAADRSVRRILAAVGISRTTEAL